MTMTRKAGDSAQHRASVFESLSLAALIVDRAGRVVDLNPAGQSLFGRPSDECVGAMLEWLLGLEANHYARQMRPALDAGRPWRGEFGFVRSDGTSGVAAAEAVPLSATGEGVVLVTVEDRTEEQRTAKERATLDATLRRAASEWQRSFDATDTLLLITDPTGRVRRLNRAAVDELGMSFAEAIGRHVDEGPGALWRMAGELCASATAAKATVEARVDEPATGRRWVLIANPVADAAGLVESLVLSARARPGAIGQAPEDPAVAARSVVQAVLRGLAHELRNPVFAITMALDSFKQRASPSDVELLLALRQDFGRIDALIEDMARFSRPLKCLLRPVAFEQIVERAAAACRTLADERCVRLVLRLDDCAPALLDEGLALECTLAVLAEAVENAPPTSAIEISMSSVLVGVVNYVRCTIRDYGPVIGREDLDHVFVPFFSRRRRGFGLALPIAHRLAEAQGGRMAVSIPEDGGVAVILEMPCVVLREAPNP